MDSMNRGESIMMDPSLGSLGDSPPYPDMPPQEDVDEFLRKKRKAREHKACYPCRQRKVKCDLSRPCQTCRDREHPELCSYHPPNKRQNGEQGAIAKGEEPSAAPFVTLARPEFEFLCRKLTTLESSIADLKREMKRNASDRTPFHDAEIPASGAIDPAVQHVGHKPSHTDVHGVHVRNDAGNMVHFGPASIPGMLSALQMNEGQAQQLQIQEMLGKTVLPLFGLDNESATYPFVDLWGLPHGSRARGEELAKALPSDAQMLNLFRCYRDMGYVIYAGIVSPDQLEADLTMFLINRAAQSGTDSAVNEQQIYGKGYTWLALMFAVLASGAQCSAMPRKERELTSQVYVCCSFECLRFTNFLSQSNLESIQSLIVIGNVMTNNLNAGTSWSLLGLTIRLAQGLGLHKQCPPDKPNEAVFQRSKVWWAIVWQDALLSITYDRASAACVLDGSTMPQPQHYGQTTAYHAIMYSVSKIGLEIVRDRSRPMNVREQVARIEEHRAALSTIMRDTSEYLRDSRKCTTARESLEHWALYLHSSYHMSELCRPAINPSADPELMGALKAVCIENLVNTVEAFLGLNNVTSFARQSWAALHRALSSALMLGILGEHTRNDRANRLLHRFMNVMSDITNNIDAQEISAPIQRGLAALRKLSDSDGWGSQLMSGISSGLPKSGGFQNGDGTVKMDHSMYTPANTDSSGHDEEHSPYSVLNHILWGESSGYMT